MSARGIRVTERHFDYIRAHATTAEDDFLRELKQTALRAGFPEIWISPEQAAFMRILLQLTGAREVVEVGTLAGYAAIQMARALGAEGRVRTVEIEPSFAEFAESWVARSDVAGRVEVHRGDAREILPGFADGSADAAFIDADKDGYPEYLRQCLRIVRRGGLILVDNAFAFGQLFDESERAPGVLALREFNASMPAVRELQSVIVPFGDGCWVGVKVADPA